MNFYLISPQKDHRNFNLNNIDKITNILNVDCIQLRPKYKLNYLNIKFIYKYHSLLEKLCKKKQIKLIVNDNLDMAKKLDFDGIHLGQEDITCKKARNALGKKFIIGISCNDSLKLAYKAKEDGASYVAFGPAFKTNTKKTLRKPLNLKMLKTFEKKIQIPYTVIGGINHNNIYKLVDLNAKNIAVIESLWNYKEGPLESAIKFKEIITKKEI